LGAKSVAEAFTICPGFRPDYSTFQKATEKHDELKNIVKQFLEKEFKTKCSVEESVSLPKSRVRGRIDIVCKKSDKGVTLVEVKSVMLSKFNIRDLLQLALYAYAYSHNNSVDYENIKLVLAYRGDGGKQILIEIDGALKQSLWRIAETIEGSAPNEKGTRSKQLKILGPLCSFCASVCLFKRR
jgi:CRISPR/Cas system-associated exonuclease Cas4 (RecB family)